MTLEELRAAAERTLHELDLSSGYPDQCKGEDVLALATFVRDLLATGPSASVSVRSNGTIVLHGGNPWPEHARVIAADLLRAAEAAEREVG